MKVVAACLLLYTAAAGASDWRDALSDLLNDDAEVPSSLTSEEYVSGMQQTLALGVQRAIERLGTEDGFWGDDAVRIPIPEDLELVEKAAERLRQDKYVERFHRTLNSAAEQAVPATAEVFAETISALRPEDALDLLRASQTSVTEYFRANTSDALRERILPIVTEATDNAGLTRSYKKLLDRAGGFLGSFADLEDLDLDSYVTDQAIAGLFHYLAIEEQKLRDDPVARSTELLQAIFKQR